jgi:hypothetical protein
LTEFREAIDSGELEVIIGALYNFFEPFAFGDEQGIVQFLFFRGMFYNCQWFKNSKPGDYPKDLICPADKQPKNFVPFLQNGERPVDKLQELFQGREDVETEKIGGLNCDNPFSQLLSGKYSIDGVAFINAIECLKNKKFISKWREQQDGLKKNQPANGNVAQNSEQAGSKEWLTERYKMLPAKIKKELKLPFEPKNKAIPEAIAILPFKNNFEKTIFMDRYTSHWNQKDRAETIGTSETAYSRDRKKW